MQPLPSRDPSPPSNLASTKKGSKIGRAFQLVADKVSDLFSSNHKVGSFVSIKDIKATPLTYDEIKVGGIYVLQTPPDNRGEILYKVMRVIEKPETADKDVGLIMIGDDKTEPQYVFAKWMRNFKD